MKDKTKPTEFRSDKKTKSLRLAALAAVLTQTLLEP